MLFKFCLALSGLVGAGAVLIFLARLVWLAGRTQDDGRRKRLRGLALMTVVILGICLVYSVAKHCCPFPTPDAVAEYAHGANAVLSVEGNESCLIYYTGPKASGWMISPKTASGYRIGWQVLQREERGRAVTSTAITPAVVLRSREVSDVYVCVYGMTRGEAVAVEDCLGSAFALAADVREEAGVMTYKAAAYLGQELPAAYEVTVTDEEGAHTIRFDGPAG